MQKFAWPLVVAFGFVLAFVYGERHPENFQFSTSTATPEADFDLSNWDSNPPTDPVVVEESQHSVLPLPVPNRPEIVLDFPETESNDDLVHQDWDTLTRRFTDPETLALAPTKPSFFDPTVGLTPKADNSWKTLPDAHEQTIPEIPDFGTPIVTSIEEAFPQDVLPPVTDGLVPLPPVFDEEPDPALIRVQMDSNGHKVISIRPEDLKKFSHLKWGDLKHIADPSVLKFEAVVIEIVDGKIGLSFGVEVDLSEFERKRQGNSKVEIPAEPEVELGPPSEIPDEAPVTSESAATPGTKEGG